MVVINYRAINPKGGIQDGEPSEELIKVAKEFQKKVADQLIGKSRKAMTDWVEKEEYEEIR